MEIINYIKSLDVFGHPITLNLHQSKGAYHKTIYGGIASALLKLALLVIFIDNIQDMLTDQNSKKNTQQKLQTVQEMKQIVSYKETGIITGLSIYGQDGPIPIPKIPDEVKEYVSIKSVQSNTDWLNMKFNDTEYDLIPCEAHTEYQGVQLS